MAMTWDVRDGDVRLPVEEAEWWGAALAVLVAVFHHPHLLAEQQPGTDPLDVARDVLDGLEELREAVAAAVTETVADPDGGRRRPSVRRDGQDVVFSPGHEVADLGWCLELFAAAVLEPAGEQAGIARGSVAHAASAWSRDIGLASGAL